MSSPDTEGFYLNTPVIERFSDVLNPDNYRPLPEDWLIAITDIVNSTKAIEKGKYKEVNLLGASSIIGILNVTGHHAIPFTFCGDGSVICVPSGLEQAAKSVLYRCREIGGREYNLNLRVAIIPVSYIRKQGYEINVARYRISGHYEQAFFTGGGIGRAEVMLKNSAVQQFHITRAEKQDSVSFSGLECRWKEVKAGHKEAITLLVLANPGRPDGRAIYEEVVEKLRALFGFDFEANPVDANSLSMHFSVPELMSETRFRTFGMSLFQQLKYFLKVEFEILLGKIFMKFEYRTSKTDWGRYKTDLSLNSDFRKFDDMLRVVISGAGKQRKHLESFLQQKFEASELAYGLHISNSVIVTCMVFQYHRDHIHFVDGSNGGYVKASKDLKKRMEKFFL